MNTDMKSFEYKLDELFTQGSALGYINDTIWVSDCETLHDAVLRIWDEVDKQ